VLSTIRSYIYLQDIRAGGLCWLFMSCDESSYKADEQHDEEIADEQENSGSERKHEQLEA
jgi:hypothetical protein